jgi:hypothetical protein
MANESDAGLAPVANTRQVTIDALCEHFANDIMSVEEFERRVDAAHSATSVDALKKLLQDLPGGGLPAVVEPQTTSTPEPNSQFTVTLAGQVKEKASSSPSWAAALVGDAGARRGRTTPWL